MIKFYCTPPAPTKKIDRLFTQTISMRDGDRHLGHATWAATNPSEGAIQLLELWIDPALRRHGHGRRLFHATLDQARDFHRLNKTTLRRIWIGVGHKTQVIGRSFLTCEGFHLIGSTSGLLEDQDLLIYVKSLD